MAEGKTKLFKIASEINIGKEAIVDYLKNKGYAIENKPTATLSDDMVDAVYDKFKKEKRAAEVQRVKIQKHKDIKKTNVDKANADDYEDDYEDEEPQISKTTKTINDVSLVIPKATQVSAPEVIESSKNIESKSEATEEIKVPEVQQPAKQETSQEDNFKVGSVINLGGKKPADNSNSNRKSEHPKKSDQSKRNDKRNKSNINKPLGAEIRIVEATKADLKSTQKPKKVAKPQIIDEPKSINKAVSAEPVVSAKEEIISKATEVNLQENAKTEVTNKVAPKSDAPEKAKVIAEEIDDESTGIQTESLEKVKGLTVLGKISISREKPGKKKRIKRDINVAEVFSKDSRNKPREKTDGNRPNDNRGGQGGSGNRPNDNRGGQGGARQGDNRGGQGTGGNRPYENRSGGQGGGGNRPNDNRGGQGSGGNRPNDNRGGQGGGGNRPYENRTGGGQGAGGNRPYENRSGGQGSGNRPYENRTGGGQGAGGNRPNNDNRTGNNQNQDRNFNDRPNDRSGGSISLRDRGVDTPRSFDKDAENKFKFGPPASADANKNALDDKKKKKKKKSIRDSISEVDVDRAIRETLAEMDSGSGLGSRAKMRLKKKLIREEKEQIIQEEKERESKTLQLTEFVTTGDLATMMAIGAGEIILKCMQLGLMVTINQRLDKDTITLIADDYGFEVEFVDEQQISIIEDDEDDDPADLEWRPPIVTIMGHVDHGKTSLLDYIRKSQVVAGEAGGITQHIGAYRVEVHDGKSITFLDTPGHEAFTAMRARGAKVTDIVILVVAADDSVMPQTIEAISHAKAAEVPIVVAINKIDKPDAKPERIKQQLADYNVLVEEWGGKNQSVEISAKQGLNIDKLLDAILLEAELLDLKANPKRKAKGTVVEANMDKGLGPVTTLVVQSGTLKIGDPFVAGVSAGRVRNMFDERGHKIEIAYPSWPVRVIGFDSLPTAGDNINVMTDDSQARYIANQRMQFKREQERRQVRHVTLDDISQQISVGGVQNLNLIVKGDVSGSVEALSDSLQKLSHDEVKINILHKGVGTISESDVNLAIASGAIIIGFQVTPSGKARKTADDGEVEIRLYDIIYDCINDIQKALEGMLRPDISEEVSATIEIRQVFKTSKLGNIAGCYVLEGTVHRNDKVRLLRDGLEVFRGGINTLKRHKDDAKEVNSGFECGIMLEGFNDIKVDDIIEAFKVIETKRKIK